jgi:hypothetical protein
VAGEVVGSAAIKKVGSGDPPRTMVAGLGLLDRRWSVRMAPPVSFLFFPELSSCPPIANPLLTMKAFAGVTPLRLGGFVLRS